MNSTGHTAGGLTVGILRKFLEDKPDDMPVAVCTRNSLDHARYGEVAYITETAEPLVLITGEDYAVDL